MSNDELLHFISEEEFIADIEKHYPERGLLQTMKLATGMTHMEGSGIEYLRMPTPTLEDLDLLFSIDEEDEDDYDCIDITKKD